MTRPPFAQRRALERFLATTARAWSLAQSRPRLCIAASRISPTGALQSLPRVKPRGAVLKTLPSALNISY